MNSCLFLLLGSAPCAPVILSVTQVNSSTVQVFWTPTNTQANYSIIAEGQTDSLSCSSGGTSCYMSVTCGSTYEVSAYATTEAGQSLPSYAIPLETGAVKDIWRLKLQLKTVIRPPVKVLFLIQIFHKWSLTEQEFFKQYFLLHFFF